MDFSIPLVFVGLFIVACLSLIFVYIFGMKEQSYEEAVAEQRQQTHALLGTKAKPKEKKSKKPAKKQSRENKVKPATKDLESDASENTESNLIESVPKIHVEFKEEPEEVPVKEVVQVPTKPKRIKKVRPILIKKEKSPERVILDITETPSANRFEENPPKDDFELKRSISREDVSKQEVKEKNTKEKKQQPTTITEVAAPPVRPAKKQTKQTSTNHPPAVSLVGNEASPEKEIEEQPMQPVLSVHVTNGIIGNPGKEKKKKKSEYNTIQQMTAERDGLINSVRKAELSKYEIQLLIDLLLNKQLEAPAIIDEWSEGKSDPVQKLKKQLMEKEKALAEEKEALLGAQAKLKEVRVEQQGERVQLQQKIRALDEILQNKQIEVQAANNKAQVNTQKLQQLQSDLNNEALKVRKLMEENAGLQIQIQQIQENDTLTALRNDYEEMKAQNQQLLMERQQLFVQLREIQTNLEQSNEINQQLKESKQLLERDFNMERTNLNAAIQQQYDEKINIERTLHQQLENEKMESAKIINQLKSELRSLQDQLVHNNSVAEESKNYQVKIRNLDNELTSVKNELNSLRGDLQKNKDKYKTELDNNSKICEALQKELDEQKDKNNELRTLNWKVNEALKAAERRAQESTTMNNNLAAEIISREQEAQKLFILRLFPEIDELNYVSADNWQEEYTSLINNYVKDLENSRNKQASLPSSLKYTQDIAKLEAQVKHYKTIIDETEGMLNKLQLQIEEEEIKWKSQLEAKDAEIEQIKDVRLNTLENKVSSLEQELAQSIEEKQRLKDEIQLFNSHSQKKSPSINKYSDPTATIEQLSEEISRLKEQLRLEQSKNGDVNICLKAPNNFTNARNGAAALIEVPTIKNSNICSSMGCQFLYCDGNSCQANS